MTMQKPRRSRRPIDGVLALDKPAGLTSNAALQQAKRLLRAAKAGHTGNLDPIATGLLPICFGEATKFSQFLLDADKGYEAEITLGVTTDTGDAEGQVLARQPVNVERAEVEAALARFRGTIVQVPPMHSALKHQGRPLYEYARRGMEVEREPRRVTIHRLELLAVSGDRLRIRALVSKGTYIRVLAEDIGRALGCGAHLSALRRTRVGRLSVDQAVSLASLEALDEAERERLLLPVDCLVEDFPAITLEADAAYYFRHGQAIWRPRLSVGTLHRVYAPEGIFLGVAVVDEEGRLAPRRLIATP